MCIAQSSAPIGEMMVHPHEQVFMAATRRNATAALFRLQVLSRTSVVKLTVLGRLGSMRGNKKVRFMGIAKINQEDLGLMAELLKQGKVKPVIEKRHGLGEVGRALQYIGGKHALRKVAISVTWGSDQ